MKKSFKLIALILAITMLAVSLCSCRDLDEAKANRAVYTSADHTEIEYKGNIYRLLNLGKYDFIDYYYGGLDSYYVSDEDVPVLLSDWYGNLMYVNKDETFLQTSISAREFASILADESLYDVQDYDGYSALYGDEDVYYVREDIYDDVKKAAESEKLDCYYFEYWDEVDCDNLDWDDVDYDSLDWDEYEDSHHVVKLDNDVTKVVNDALKARSKGKISYKELNSEYQNFIQLGTCDRNKILCTSDDDIYLVQDKENYYFVDGNIAEHCLVPLNKDDSKLIAKLFSDYPDAVYEGQVAWLFDDGL